MRQAAVLDLLRGRLLPLFASERAKVQILDRWYWIDHDKPKLPSRAGKEAKALRNMAVTSWPRLAVTTVAQLLRAEGAFSADRPEADTVWRPWNANRWNSRQIPCYKAALAYGQAFAQVSPGQDGRAVMRAYSPLESLAAYGDEVDDDWPLYFVRVVSYPNETHLVRLVDSEASYFLSASDGFGSLEFIEAKPHGLGVCPVVRFANDLDLSGRTPGEVEPLIPIAKRINKTDYDRLLAQHFNSWKVKWATGLDDSRTEEESERVKLRLAQDDVLIAGQEVQFGTLEQTALDGFIKSRDSDIEAFAAVSQTPPTTYGKIVNVSAEGLAAARASLYAKRDERKATFGESIVQLLRLAAQVEGRMGDAEDMSITVKWADTDIRTMAEAVDALGKAATMLDIPPEKLWDRIPDVDVPTADSWRQYAQAHPSAARLAADAELRAAGLAVDALDAAGS
jgi:hypothetical protein